MKKVSVIVPVYNVEKYLGRCLETLINQTLKDIEIIIVNDGSIDGSQTIIDNYKNKYQAGSAVETCPAVLSDEQTAQMQRFAEAAYRSVGMQSYARFDFMMDEKTGNMYCLEANTLPGMTPTSLLPQEAAAVGMNFNQLCEKIIEISLKRYSA